MSVRFAFAGFRHGHIMMVYAALRNHPDAVIVAAAEDDEATRAACLRDGVILTHSSVEQMLDEVDCDVVAVGQHYGGRGTVVRMALERGRHVLADKPLCCAMADYEAIARLSREKGLSVIVQFDLRGDGRFLALRRIVRDGAPGEVRAVSFGGQHPLLYGKGRPDWYFEPGLHGGILNDIAVHAMDFIPWITGRRFAFIESARAWNAGFDEVPFFQNAGQAMLTLDNGAGVLGDVSYFAPDSFGYGTPYYWRTTIWCRGGVSKPPAARLTLFSTRKATRRRHESTRLRSTCLPRPHHFGCPRNPAAAPHCPGDPRYHPPPGGGPRRASREPVHTAIWH